LKTRYKLPPSLMPAVQLAMQANPDAMVTVLNKRAMFCFVSPSVERLFGYTPAEVIGRHFSDFFDANDATHIRLALTDAAMNGQSVAVTRNVRMREGGFRTMKGPARAMRDGDTGELYELAIGWRVE
jgi:PAS domain S-box-containing protein